MRKIIALAMATLMVVAMAFTAFAVNITINADSTFTSGTAGSGVGNLYTWYRIFTATMDPSSGTTTGGGSGSFWYKSGTGYYDGIDATSYGNVAYTASATVANLILAAVDTTKDSGTGVITSPYFILTPIEGTNTYSVKWDETKNDTTGANIRLAADWLLENVASQLPDSEKGSFTYANGAWTADVGTAGYYLIESAVGKNLIAATTDIEINEKNVYPSIDKTQADEDSGTHTDDNISVAIGDVIDYQIKVTVPDTIKSGDILTVWDTVTKGLTLTGTVEVSVDGTTVTDWTDATSAGYAWKKTLTITDSNITQYAGKEVIFTYSMTVTSDALVDTDKENTAGLEFGDASGTYFETVPDKVGFDTYFGGIVKMDGNTEDLLEGVTFTLYETFSGTTAEYPVVLSGSYYYPATSGTSGSAIVTTNSSGTIIIRGLDDDKDYTLVELGTLPGYNLLSGSVTLTLQKDDGSGTYATTEFQPVLNFSGTVLPSTGGIGTTIFYVVGGLLAVGAGVVLVTKKRMSKEDV